MVFSSFFSLFPNSWVSLNYNTAIACLLTLQHTLSFLVVVNGGFWFWLWLWLWLARLWTLGFDCFQSTLFTLASLTQPDGDGRGKSANTENVLQVQFVPQILSAKKLQCLARRVRDLPDDGLCYTDCPGPHLTWYYL